MGEGQVVALAQGGRADDDDLATGRQAHGGQLVANDQTGQIAGGLCGLQLVEQRFDAGAEGVAQQTLARFTACLGAVKALQEGGFI